MLERRDPAEEQVEEKRDTPGEWKVPVRYVDRKVSQKERKISEAKINSACNSNPSSGGVSVKGNPGCELPCRPI